jgi:hypothetical protein
MRFVVRALAALLAPLLGCTTSSSVDASVADAGNDGNRPNACVAAGGGYQCQSACGAGYVNVQDLPCGSGMLCCGPLGEGGLDATDDATVLVDSAVFETGSVDAGHDSGTRDAGKDATPEDAGVDAAHDDGRDASHSPDAADAREPVDAATDVHHG